MRARSWMAALALIGGAGILAARGLPAPEPVQTTTAHGAAADATPAAPPPMTSAMAPTPSITVGPADTRSDGVQPNHVRLSLVIAGLGPKGCDVEIQPANAGCKFRVPPPRHVSSEGTTLVELDDVEVRGADHMLTLAIAMREPGQPPVTLYRGFRMARPTTKAPASSGPRTAPKVASFTCYLSSRVASVDPDTARR